MSVTPSPGLLLLGFFSEKQALGILSRLCVCSDTRPHALRAMWVEARKHRGGSIAKAGQPALSEVSPDLEEHVEKVLSLPRLAGGVDGLPVGAHMVEIERLYAYQAGVHLDRVAAVEHALGKSPTPSALANVCLPLEAKLDFDELQIDHLNPTIRLATGNHNAQVQGLAHGEPHPETGWIPLFFLVGEREPCIQVIEYKGRYFLRNGYHRVVGAMRCGATHIPALTMHANSWKDVHAQLGDGLLFDPRDLGDEMPTMRHFDSACEVPLRAFETVMEFSWKAYPRPI